MSSLNSITLLHLEVLQPTSPQLIDKVSGDSGLAIIGTQQSEYDLTLSLDAESFIHHYPPLLYHPVDFTNTVVDNLYNESSGEIIYTDPILIPILIQLNPQRRLLRKFGVETEQDAIGLLSQGWLAKYQPTLNICVGDRIEYFDGGTTFTLEVLTTKFTDYFGNTQVALHRLVTLKNLNQTVSVA